MQEASLNRLPQAEPDAFPFRYQNGRSASAVPRSGDTAVRPTQLRRPSRFRFLAAGLLLAVTCAAGLTVWNVFFRYQAYGVVTGNIVEVSPAIDGQIRFLHVREGERISNGQTLVTLDDLDTEQQLDRIHDELRVAEATLHAQIARQRWEIDVQMVESERAVAEYSQSLSTLETESAELLQRRAILQRTELLATANATTDDQVENARISEDGQQRHVEALKAFAGDLKARAERVARLARPGAELIQPGIAKCNSLLNELERVKVRLSRRLIASSVAGTILQRHRSVGEQIRQAEPVYSLLEADSLRIELYVPQSRAEDFEPGTELSLNIEPYREPLLCEVIRISDGLVPPPKSVEIYYRAKTPVVSVYLRPIPTQQGQPPVRVGSIVRLAKQWK